VVEPGEGRDDGAMTTPEPITVWMVHLEKGLADKDVKGTLDLDDLGLLFTEDKAGGPPARLTFESIRRARRVRGSPVMVIEWALDGAVHRTAFYFTQPPPLIPSGRGGSFASALPDDPPPRTAAPFSMLRRSGKRKAQRTNAQYLQTSGISKKELISGWTIAVSERIGQTR
jgi:hypothetical protein